MRNFMVMVVLLVSITLIACSATDTGPTEEGLRKRAEAFATASSNGKWIDVHRFYIPDYQERCPSGDFAVWTGMGMAMLKGMMGIDEDEEIEFHVISATVTLVPENITALPRGSVTVEMLYNGEPLSFGDSKDGEFGEWVFIDGEWSLAPDKYECPGF